MIAAHIVSSRYSNSSIQMSLCSGRSVGQSLRNNGPHLIFHRYGLSDLSCVERSVIELARDLK